MWSLRRSTPGQRFLASERYGEIMFELRAVGCSHIAVQVWEAHRTAKHQMLEDVNRASNAGMDVDMLTLGFARRATAYKRPDLLFQDIERLQRLAALAGGLQVIYAGKAHPQDNQGKELIKHIYAVRRPPQKTTSRSPTCPIMISPWGPY